MFRAMPSTEWSVAVGDDATSALLEPTTATTSRGVMVCAHGAGGSMRDKGMTAVANALRAHGFDVVRYNFLYKEKGRGGQDPMPVFKRCLAAVVAHTRAELGNRK